MVNNIAINDRNIRMQIWDTDGQEAFRSITRSYYKSSTFAFIVYDISEKKLFMILIHGYKILGIYASKIF